jgi:hypothetical protein
MQQGYTARTEMKRFKLWSPHPPDSWALTQLVLQVLEQPQVLQLLLPLLAA